MEEVILEVEGSVRASSVGKEKVRDVLPCLPHSKHMRLEEIGRDLFAALFQDSVRVSFLQSLGRIEGQPHAALRLRLMMDPLQPQIGPLCALPWELLYRPDTRDFLSRQLLTTLVRQLNVPRLTSPSPIEDSHLRILVAVSSPKGLTSLDLDAEEKRIRESWGARSDVEVDFLKHASIQKLSHRLKCEPFHVFHFMGHGTFDDSTAEGALLFENSAGTQDPVRGKVLAEILRQNRQLRLVFLNSCCTAQFPRCRGQDPYSGVGSALVMSGIPVVLAMQFPISDSAAIVFSNAFYSTLATGSLVETAVTDGRMALYEQGPDSYEWATPVLFLSMPEGLIFKPTADAATGIPILEEDKEKTLLARRNSHQSDDFTRSNYVEISGRVSGHNVNIGKNLSFHQTESTSDEAKYYQELGLKKLRELHYNESARNLQVAVEKGSGTADTYYYLALATLARRRPRFLGKFEILEIEECLHYAIQKKPRSIYYLLWAFLKYDYYATNCLRIRPPTPKELVDSALAGDLKSGDIKELLRHIPTTSNNPVNDLIRKIARI